MSYQSNWSNGGWITICDACGRKFKDSELRQRWDGLMVCSGDWEVRQPQDYVRGVADIQAPPYVRPEQANVFLPYFFTQYPDEPIDVQESVRKRVTKYLGGFEPGSIGSVNSEALNANYIGYSEPSIDLERVTITEVVLAILGRNLDDSLSLSETTAKTFTKGLTDSVSIGESLQLVEVEQYVEDLSLSESVTATMNYVRNVSESVGVAETVSRVLVSTTTLNGSALNSSVLD